jgi:16S rRNA (guanine1207-N2)-methyltransferase
MSHYFTNDNTLKSDMQKHTIHIGKDTFSFYTDSGVFSKKGLDFGTRTLLETLPLEQLHGDILDFGCGYGPIGIFIKKKVKAQVDMLDVNQRSLSLARQNAILNQADVTIFESNIYQNVLKKYDYIISNPPIRVGKETLYQILFGAKDHLKENGELWIVINKDQGAKSVIKDLSSVYDVKLVNKNKGFFIIVAKIR